MHTVIKLDRKRAMGDLQRIASRDIPYALSRGVNLAGLAAREELKREIPMIFKTTNAFTRNAIGFTPSTKHNQTAVIFIKDQQAKYLRFEEYGGTRTSRDNTVKPAPRALVIAASGAKRNASGTLPKGYVEFLYQKFERDRQNAGNGKRQKNRDKARIVRIGERKGRLGGLFSYVPATRSLVRLISFAPRATYRPKFGFHARIAGFLDTNLPRFLGQAIDAILSKGK